MLFPEILHCVPKLLLATTVAKNDCLEFLNIHIDVIFVLSTLIAKGSYYILVECAQLSMIVIQVPSQFCRARFRSGCPAIAPSPYQPTIYYLCRSQLEEASVIFSLPVIIVCLYGLIHLQGVHFEANELPLLCV